MVPDVLPSCVQQLIGRAKSAASGPARVKPLKSTGWFRPTVVLRKFAVPAPASEMFAGRRPLASGLKRVVSAAVVVTSEALSATSGNTSRLTVSEVGAVNRPAKAVTGAEYVSGLYVTFTGAFVTVMTGVMFTAPPPPASPGPVAALPATSERPSGTKYGAPARDSPAIALLRVCVTAPTMVTSCPAHIIALPSVVVIVPFMKMSRPALRSTLALTIVMAAGAATVMSWPQHTTM